jgi:ABC-type oligopeptide transport system substrate-binding subunit/class 3 adenylate cyclase
LFTDIEGSTKLLKQLAADRYGDLLADQRRILRSAFEQYNGSEIDTQGDSFFVSFPRATQALTAVVEIQRSLADHDWPEGIEVRLRMGLHTGEPLVAEEGYVGMDVHRAARIAHVGHGGQVLLSETTAPLVKGELPEGVSLLDLGRHRLKDMRRPEWIHQLVIEGLSAEFPPVKSLEMLRPAGSLDFGEINLPAFLEGEEVEVPPAVFVGRKRELTRLSGYLDQAGASQGGIVFITGGPGRGKTALMGAFARQAMEGDPDLLVTAGKCNAYTGTGDPYAPFREILGDLTGDVEAKWAAGGISSDHAKRLWQILPETAQAIVDHGPDLVEVFIPGKGLLHRLSLALPEGRTLRQSLQALTERERATPGELEQKALFEQYLEVLCQLASKRPLLILLDDLQWADSASLNLLFHLGREIPGGRILFLCAYRPEEVALGRGDERHPLEAILAEFKRTYGDAWIDLSQTEEHEGQRFVDDFIDSEPNRLGGAFREALLAHTEGHPLFTIELLREMQARGDLVRDEDGYWVEGEALNWELLPARVEGVIEARIGRLEEELREILTIASVEGEDFTAQVVARVKEASERGLVRQLSGKLDKVHRLVGERGSIDISGQRLYLYRFQHHIFQKFLYNGLGGNDREMLHAEVGGVLEELYGEQGEEIAALLVWHFSEAGKIDKAIHYSLLAGDRARQIYAYQEAIDFYQLAIRYLKSQGDDERAPRTLMKLGLTYHTIFDYQRSRQAYDEAFTFRQRMDTTQSVVLEPAPHSLRLQFEEPSTLDPTKSDDNISNFFIENIFSGLVELGIEWEIFPDVAHSWEISEDGCRYLFYLRDDVYWSDGTQVTAEDFEYAWRCILESATKPSQYMAFLFYDVRGERAYQKGEVGGSDQVRMSALDALTLEVELDSPASYFLHLMTFFYPVPRHIVEAYGDAWIKPENLTSNGPFLLDSYLPGKTITLARNPTYHGGFFGNLQAVEVRFGLEQNYSEALERYRSSSVDLVRLEYATYDARRQYIGEYFSVPWPATFFVGFDTSRPPFDDYRVGQAFVMAADRNKLVEEVLRGFHDPGTGGFVPPGMPGHSPGIALPYDPDQARQLLAQAGYPEGQSFPNLELLVWPRRAHIVEYLVAQWLHNLNVEISIEIIQSFEEIIGMEQKNNLFFRIWDASYLDPDEFLRLCVRAKVPHWHNEIYDQIMEKAHQSSDQADRIRLYQAADKILTDEAVIMPVAYDREHYLVKPWVKFTGGILEKTPLKNIIIEPH